MLEKLRDAGNKEKYFGKGTGKGKRPRKKTGTGEEKGRIFRDREGKEAKTIPGSPYSSLTAKSVCLIDTLV
jgi:hypothetical protein